MRIIAGEDRGRRLHTPLGKETRPTSDRVKESLFNMLGKRVPDARVLDLFAGTGNLGLESISRGAAFCIFIDKSKEAYKVIKENVELLKYQDYCEIYNNDAFTALDILKKRSAKFDIIFIDPPYHKDIVPPILKKIIETDIINSHGIIVTEHDIRDPMPDNISILVKSRMSVYGDTVISLYEKMEE